MSAALVFALAMMAAPSADQGPIVTNPTAAQSQAQAPANAPSSGAGANDGDDDMPSNAPKDPYELVSWCYGALDEYISLYDVVKPDLKEIDKLFGSPVMEKEPYADDVAGERLALKRFADAMQAAERASPQAISERGLAAMRRGRSIWAPAKLLPHRQMADAWLFWGVPKRCESTAKTLKDNATLLGQALVSDAPAGEAPAAASPGTSGDAAH